MSELYSLAYISKNAIQGDLGQIEHEIKSILASAHRKNPQLNITGALLFSGGYFCQVIEGPEASLEELIETIQMDERHNEVTVLQYEPIAERGFAEWDMALAGVEDEASFDIEGLLRSKEDLKTLESGRYLVETLEKLVKQHQSVLSPEA